MFGACRVNFFYKIAMLQSNAPQAQNTSIYRLEKFWLVSFDPGIYVEKISLNTMVFDSELPGPHKAF